MTLHWKLLGAATLAALLATPARAYNEFVTHQRLTEISAKKSALYADPALMFRLGLPPAEQQSYRYRARINKYYFYDLQVPFTIAQLIAEGAVDEDQGSKSVNHFFDPVHNSTLSVPFMTNYRSPDWIVEDNPLADQDYSLRDARDYLARALTFNDGAPAASEAQRVAALGNVFFALGAAMHHMQDMHQPQHVRNDQHLDHPFGLPVYWNVSRYEHYTRDNPGSIEAAAQSGTPVFPGNPFTRSRDFWTNAGGTGAADVTNRSYVSWGTNFTIDNGVPNAGGPYQLPIPGAVTNPTVQQLFDEVPATVPTQLNGICGTPANGCIMTMYATGPAPRGSTLSIFDQDLQKNGLRVSLTQGFYTQRLFSLNRFNFESVYPSLIPNAVGFSAGLVNHFFRGKIEVSPPASGAYAVVDHSAGQGFGTVRATLKNATPNEALDSGSVMAIARFHRNNCYKPDLSGEWTEDAAGNPVPPCDDYSSDEEHIRVAVAQALSLGAGLQQELTFTFSDPIPLDATELILQVLFRGTVGAEPQAIALGAVDISEPTWVAVMNGTDVFEIPAGATNKFFYFGDIIANVAQSPYSIVDRNGNQVYDTPPDVDVRGGDINYSISVDGKKVGDVGALPPGRFFRLAALVNPDGFSLALTSTGNGFQGTTTYDLPAKTAQIDYARNEFVVSTVDQLRNQTLQYDSVTYWHYYPVTSASSDDMLISKAVDATTPLAVTMTPP